MIQLYRYGYVEGKLGDGQFIDSASLRLDIGLSWKVVAAVLGIAK